MNVPPKPAIPLDSKSERTGHAEPELSLVYPNADDHNPDALNITPQHISKNAPKKRRRAWLDVSLGVTDIICIIAAFTLASILRFGGINADQMLNMLGVSIPIYLAIAFNWRAYGTTVLGSFWTSFTRAATSLLITMGAVILAAFFLKASAEFSRLLFAAGTMLSLIFLFGGRWLMIQLSRRILGNNPMAEIIIQDGIAAHYVSDSPVIDAVSQRLEPDLTDPVIVQRLGLLTRDMDRIIVHCSPEKRQSWAFTLKSLDINAEIVIPELDDLAPLALNRRQGHLAVTVGKGPLKWNERIIKRLFDLAFVACVLPILAAPVLVVAILIKLESPGPVLFRQKRIGLGNRPFSILKFRSMRTDMEDKAASKLTERDDPRITKIGHFIRKTSIDELPQLLNVLLGDMSVVGPRPHAEQARAGKSLYWEVDNSYWHRHVVKPGITGLAQIRGHRGNTFHEDHLRNRLQSDLEYVSDWSLLTDIKIILLTVSVLSHKNAF